MFWCSHHSLCSNHFIWPFMDNYVPSVTVIYLHLWSINLNYTTANTESEKEAHRNIHLCVWDANFWFNPWMPHWIFPQRWPGVSCRYNRCGERSPQKLVVAHLRSNSRVFSGSSASSVFGPTSSVRQTHSADAKETHLWDGVISRSIDGCSTVVL